MQSVPDGYEALDFVGFTDRGEFSGTETYIENDIVHWNNTAWRCLKDNTTGVTPAEGENWTVFIASETDSAGITTTDTEGLAGPAGEKVSNQDLIDAIADRVINRLLSKSAISTTQINDPEKVPSSALVFGMAEEIGELNANITDTNDNITQNDIMMYRIPTGLSRDDNADNFKKTGYYFTSPETKNAAEYGIITVVSVPTPWVTQTWHRLDGKLYTREYSDISSGWSEWHELLSSDQINCPSFGWGFIADLNNFKQFSGSPKIMFGHGTGYESHSKNAPISSAFCAMYIPYSSKDYGVQLLFSLQHVHGSYPIYKRTLENNTWDYWVNISCPSNRYEYNGTQDWDGYLSAGVYQISHLTGQHSPSDMGVAQWGYLEVSPWGDFGEAGCLQRYYSTSGKAVYRIKYDRVWGVWANLN